MAKFPRAEHANIHFFSLMYKINDSLLSKISSKYKACYKKDKPWKHPKWARQDTKVHLWYNSISKKSLEFANL